MKTAAARPSPWEDLPPELLGLVLLRLPSLVDRVHLRAVCRPWRAGAAAQGQPVLPPPLPWLAFRDGGLVDLHGAPVRCTSILRERVFGYLVVDNLAFLVHDDGACSLMNPLSGSTLPLPKLAPAVRQALDESVFFNMRRSDIKKTHEKVVLSSTLDPTLDALVAVLIMEGLGIAVSTCKQHDAITISLGPDADWPSSPVKIVDIAFLCGNLYALTRKEGLHVIELDAGRLSELKSSSGFHQCIAKDPKQREMYGARTGPSYVVLRYLAESNGRLLMMRRWMSFPRNTRPGVHDRTVRFEVFMADLTTLPGRWTKVGSLDGQAIFLGSECSQSVLASQCAGGVQKDCIYFMHRVFDNPSKEYFGPCVDPLADSGVYNMRDGKITPLLPESTMTELWHKRQFATWFFPADA